MQSKKYFQKKENKSALDQLFCQLLRMSHSTRINHKALITIDYQNTSEHLTNKIKIRIIVKKCIKELILLSQFSNLMYLMSHT